MKKLYIAILTVFAFSLSSCSTDELSTLEKLVREYDEYTEIVDFTRENTVSMKLSVLIKDNEVTYLYYLDGIDQDKEVIITVNEEIVLEAFVVNDYVNDGIFYGTFDTTDLNIDEVTIAEIKLVNPGFHMSDSVGVDFKQEFVVITSYEELILLERSFIDASAFEDNELELYNYNFTNNRISRTMLWSAIVLIVSFLFSLYLYGKKYSKIVNYKLNNPDSKRYKKFPDLIKFRGYAIITTILVWMLLNMLTGAIYNNQYQNKTGYNQDLLRYEEVVSDEMNLRIGYTAKMREEKDYVAFLHNEGSHYITGDITVTLSGDNKLQASVFKSSYGGYNYEVNYTYITDIEFQVQVFDWVDSDDELDYSEIFSRTYFAD